MATDRVAIILDYGGVLADTAVDPFFSMLASALRTDRQSLSDAISEQTEHGHDYRADLISCEAFWTVVMKEFGTSGLDYHYLQRLWAYSYKVSTSTLSLLADIRQIPGVVLGQYSNEDRLRWMSGQRRYATEDLFDFSVLSWQVHALKGQPEFERALREELVARNCSRAIIVDDKPTHVREASDLGHIGIRFADHESLRFELERELHSASRELRTTNYLEGQPDAATTVLILMEDHLARPLQEKITGVQSSLRVRVDTRKISDMLADGRASDAIEQAHVIVYSARAIDERVLQYPRLRAVLKWGTGIDDVDLEAADRHGVDVLALPALNSSSVAEHAVMLALAEARYLRESSEAAAALQWNQAELVELGIQDLASASVGIVGFGSIGSEIWRRLRPFGCEGRYFKQRRLSRSDERELGIAYSTLPQMFADCRFIFLALPLTDVTREIITAQLLERSQERCTLINISRAEIVDRHALTRWLAQPEHRYATDVHYTEPYSSVDDLVQGKNVLATPHIAGRSENAISRLNTAAADVISAFIAGRRAHDRLRQGGEQQLRPSDRARKEVEPPTRLRRRQMDHETKPSDRERVVANRVLYAGQVFNVLERTIQLSPDNLVTWEIVDKGRDSVGIVPLDADGGVFLLEEYFGGIDQRGLALPKGLIARGENAEQAAARELREETGLVGDFSYLSTVSVSPGYLTQKTTLFLATDVHQVSSPLEEAQFQKVHRLSLDTCLRMIEAGEISEARAVAALLLVARRRNR